MNNNVQTIQKRRSGIMEVWHRMKRSPMAVIGLVLIIVLFVMALFANVIAPFTYSKQNLMHAFESPSSKYIFGLESL